MKRADVGALAEQLGRMLAAIEAGELDATPAMRHRLTGAVAVLRIVLGDEPVDVVCFLEHGVSRGLDTKEQSRRDICGSRDS